MLSSYCMSLHVKLSLSCNYSQKTFTSHYGAQVDSEPLQKAWMVGPSGRGMVAALL